MPLGLEAPVIHQESLWVPFCNAFLIQRWTHSDLCFLLNHHVHLLPSHTTTTTTSATSYMRSLVPGAFVQQLLRCALWLARRVLDVRTAWGLHVSKAFMVTNPWRSCRCISLITLSWLSLSLSPRPSHRNHVRPAA